MRSQGLVRDLIHRFKYGREFPLRRVLGDEAVVGMQGATPPGGNVPFWNEPGYDPTNAPWKDPRAASLVPRGDWTSLGDAYMAYRSQEAAAGRTPTLTRDWFDRVHGDWERQTQGQAFRPEQARDGWQHVYAFFDKYLHAPVGAK